VLNEKAESTYKKIFKSIDFKLTEDDLVETNIDLEIMAKKKGMNGYWNNWGKGFI
jgi:hypothetical protein